MNRRFTKMAIVALWLAGCGSSGNNGDGGGGSGGAIGGNGSGADLSAAAGGDLAVSLPPDMQPAYGCHALAGCLATCTDQTSCGLCVQSATMQARSLYLALSRCVRKECFPVPDGGPAPCMKGVPPTPQCTMCEQDTIKATGSCGADTMYCGTCYSQYSACQANLP